MAGDATTPGGTGVCDIYAAGSTPCVAAFSTVRALYGAYGGSLYQVTRADNTTMDIAVLSPGGVADAAAQDTFCSGTTCTISIIYDQSGKGNDLTKAPKGGPYGPNADIAAAAAALPIMIGGHKAYGVHIVPSGANYENPFQTGYRNDKTTGVATGDKPESIYMVADGTYYNGSCCFDFGNAETNNMAGANGSMDAVYFGNAGSWDKGAGSGPWVMADMEDGVFSQGGSVGATNSNDLSLAYPFVTAILKNNSAGATPGPFTLEGANAQSGTLDMIYSGARPSGYATMVKQGAIILGIGGDNSSGAKGNFFEGALTAGYASTTTDNAVQANIVAAGYGH